MQQFERRLRYLVAALGRDPLDADARAALERLIDAHPYDFQAFLPAQVVTYGVPAAHVPRRIRFLKHVLLSGYLPPRFEDVASDRWSNTVNVGVVTSYFYPNALGLLEANELRPDAAVFMAYPGSADSFSWVVRRGKGSDSGLAVRAALMLEDNALVMRRFAEPVPLHFLFPVDNYYRDKFRLVRDYADCGVPMPGSALIREVCENKRLLADIVGEIPGLRLARELCLTGDNDHDTRAALVERFCAEFEQDQLVTKPIDGFGGYGVEFWSYPAQRDAMLERLDAVLAVSDVVLVQERLSSVPTHSGRDWNLRQYVLRAGPDMVESAWKRARVGHGVVNTSQSAVGITIEHLLADLDIDADERPAFEAALRDADGLACEVLRALSGYLARHHAAVERRYRGSGSNLEPDLLALDFMISRVAGKRGAFAVYINEINDFASGGMRDYDMLTARQAAPEAPRAHARHAFSLAPRVLDLALWRGRAYRDAHEQA